MASLYANSKNTPFNGLDKFSDPNYVSIFDTMLRDGEQAPGASMTATQKMDIARQLVKLGVDVIEAGFPASSEIEFELVKCIAHEIGNSVDETLWKNLESWRGLEKILEYSRRIHESP
ncbi:hypothetical protein KY290_033419 [Solanum tuberosum]|uniref:Pyruvate carboxyltransferase domain-containing protein n=1 Tax=Solanum tuberosum TaxID=4113 RepID=A0ABQ7U0N5_SOLTU|nr:hypothetical protein KY289_032779 [Solanum tuberosum]KAH0647421.1 hypothetical protein KY285_032669 [Solanum tuberosum]KAH0740376.1 hypothetical protein KY290_033419 [Solanum tuberosum]